MRLPRELDLIAVAVSVSIVASQATIAAPAGQQSGADAFKAVGWVSDVMRKGTQIWIIHPQAPKVRVPATGNELLYRDDEVEVKGEAYLLFRGSSTPLTVTEKNSPFRVETPAPQGLSGRIQPFLTSLSWLWPKRSFLRRSSTVGRGPEDGPPPPIVSLTHSTLFSAGEIVVPRDQDHVTISWCGDAARVEGWSGRSRAIVSDEGGYSRVTPGGKLRFDAVKVVALGNGSPLDFAVRRVDPRQIPRPVWLDSDPVSAEERAAWGMWLLRDAAAAYHAYGLTLIDDAKYDVPAAAQYFSAATECAAPPAA